MPADLITDVHFTSSVATNFLNSAVSPQYGSIPEFLNFSWISGFASAAPITPAIFSTTSGGRLAGPNRPAHAHRSKPGITDSSSVGTSGRLGLRVLVNTAR